MTSFVRLSYPTVRDHAFQVLRPATILDPLLGLLFKNWDFLSEIELTIPQVF